jgi:hypothetical protein
MKMTRETLIGLIKEQIAIVAEEKKLLSEEKKNEDSVREIIKDVIKEMDFPGQEHSSLFTDEIMTKLGTMEKDFSGAREYILGIVQNHNFKNPRQKQKFLKILSAKRNFVSLYQQVFNLKAPLEIGRLGNSKL